MDFHCSTGRKEVKVKTNAKLARIKAGYAHWNNQRSMKNARTDGTSSSEGCSASSGDGDGDGNGGDD
ncbi:MAG: hypothetical protein NTW11_02625 [Candidatus Staskawiczbacteria bacterium]|nr:hypothetical protein [Candidatus Staskawiczbacteria bacterium]